MSKLNEYLEEVKKSKNFNEYKIGDKVKYLGKPKNGFETNGIYTISSIRSNSVFEKQVTIKHDISKRKMIIKHPQHLEKINE